MIMPQTPHLTENKQRRHLYTGLKTFVFSWILIILPLSGFSQLKLDYYLPDGSYMDEIPAPEEVLGHQVGEWHMSHDQLNWYLMELAEASDRVIYREYARSYEDRPLFHLIITSPENHERLEEIRNEHQILSDPAQSSSVDISNMPVVVRLGYGVHGNESSASNASALVAYYLAAAMSEAVEKKLENMIILLDPCLNPDGFNRHASWINMHKSEVPMKDDLSRGFQETWPGGRTNHYWFDLNRDWILLQHPESRGRVQVFQDWKPNVQTDHHEMGSSSSFFFQPGVPSRINPYTPERTTDLTAMIGQFHSKALDSIGSLYFTEERFDDFYYGKGSSYPDVNGSVGILFEQAGTRGFERETSRGKLSFPFAIRNQVAVSLSSLEASSKLRIELLDFQREFYSESVDLFESSEVKGYVFGENGDPAILSKLVEILLQHNIKLNGLAGALTVDGTQYMPGTSYLISLDQPQIRLIKSLFEPALTFADSVFYDVSTWTFPFAFNTPYAPLNTTKALEDISGELITALKVQRGSLQGDANGVGYLFSWKDYYAPQALYSILAEGLNAQVVTEPIAYQNQHINQSFDYGSVFIPVSKQAVGPERIRAILQDAAEGAGIEIFSLSTSYTPQGVDMGSGRFVPLAKPRILLLTGDGIRSLEAGEIWHLLDTRMKIPVVLLDIDQLNTLDLSEYTHILMPSGSYGKIGESGKSEMVRWLKRGGTIIALNSANRWLAKNDLADIEFEEEVKDSTGFKAYKDLSSERGAKRISGSIFEAEIDISHPLGYGLGRSTIPVFRNSTLIAKSVSRPYAVPLRYTSDPLLSGYVPQGIYDKLRSTPAAVISSRGNGKVISFVDNPNFRGYWYGTNRLFMNAIFFGPLISSYSSNP